MPNEEFEAKEEDGTHAEIIVIPFTPKFGKYIIFHYLSKVRKATFFSLFDVVFLVRLQEKFEIDQACKHGKQKIVPKQQLREENTTFAFRPLFCTIASQW